MQPEKLVSRIFIVTESIIYITFIILDLSAPVTGYSDNVRYFTGIRPDCSDYLKYAGIVLVFAHALFLCIRSYGRDRLLITCALFFTATADIFLLFFVKQLFIIPGLVSFSITQTLYSFLLTDGKVYKRILIPSVFLVLAAGLAVLIGRFLYFDFTVTLLVALVFYYTVMFVCNTIRSWCIFIKHRQRFHLVFSIGLTLFVLCDINVLLRNLNSFFFGIVPAGMVSTAIILSWVFYLPAQVLISLSLHLLKSRKETILHSKQ